ncbi:Type II secretion system F domain protein [Desulfotomaculum nigrificans CO-1-SRB]|uniref:Type II secretion system F domain protein n=2 Tax=Desulfotomaculum nigrificans TaxID=1565 RepID=F6BA51_DESCC|nr:Type II secretion system F domain protein [Desulfotomaculum nigrificans CO-1-SRB]
MEASSPSEVAGTLRLQGVYVTDILETKQKTVREKKFFSVGKLAKLNVGFKKVKLRELATFARQLSTLINSGIPLISCINITRSQTESKVLKSALGDILSSLEDGNTLSNSFAKFPNIFPEIFIYMVEAGELGGVLDEVMERLADHLEREHDVNEKIKSALTYPLVVLIFSMLALSFLLTFVLPKIINVIQGMGVPLPLPTRIVMAVSGVFINFWFLIPFIIFLLFFGFKYIASKPKGQETLDIISIKAPIFGSIYQKIIVARFCRTLGTLLKGGVPIIQALEVVKKSVNNVIISRAVTKAQERVRNGQELSKPIEECGLFPPMVIKMIAVGEETGSLDILLERVGIFYDKEVGILVGRLSSVIEPLLIVLLGGIVGFIILAVMLPMISSMMKGLS